MSRKDTMKNLTALPWVTQIEGDVPCEGIKWSSLAMKDVPSWRDLPADHRARCKRKARYILKATTRTRGDWEFPATSGSYCATHVALEISNHGAENRRANRFFDKNGWWRDGVFGMHQTEKMGDSE